MPLKEELAALGIRRTMRSDGGLECMSGDIKSVWTVAYKSRLAEGIKVRMSPPFVAGNFTQLRQELKRWVFALYVNS